MKEKLLKLIQNHKKLLLIFSRVVILAIIVSEGIYIKYQHDIIFNISNASKDVIFTQTTQSTQNKQKDTDSSTEKEIKLGEPFNVNTSNGDYKFTIEKAIKSDEFNSGDKELVKNNQTIVELFIDCENISFNKNQNKGVTLQDAFNVKDNNNYNLKPYYSIPASYSDGYYETLSNSKSKICLSYFADKNITSINVTFNRGGNITIPLT